MTVEIEERAIERGTLEGDIACKIKQDIRGAVLRNLSIMKEFGFDRSELVSIACSALITEAIEIAGAADKQEICLEFTKILLKSYTQWKEENENNPHRRD